MLLTRKARYGLISVKHLAEQLRENSFSAKDQRTFMDFPRKRWPKILQRLARAGLLLSHHGIKGGYTLARDPRQISVLDVIKASEEAPRDAIERKTRAALGVRAGLPPTAHGQPNRRGCSAPG